MPKYLESFGLLEGGESKGFSFFFASKMFFCVRSDLQCLLGWRQSPFDERERDIILLAVPVTFDRMRLFSHPEQNGTSRVRGRQSFIAVYSLISFFILMYIDERCFDTSW